MGLWSTIYKAVLLFSTRNSPYEEHGPRSEREVPQSRSKKKWRGKSQEREGERRVRNGVACARRESRGRTAREVDIKMGNWMEKSERISWLVVFERYLFESWCWWCCRRWERSRKRLALSLTLATCEMAGISVSAISRTELAVSSGISI